MPSEKNAKHGEKRRGDDSEAPAAPQGPGAVEGAAGRATASPEEDPSENLPAEPVFTETELNERLEAAAAEARERHLRVVAEYDNYRKRVQREREMWSAEAIEKFVVDLLPVLDNFDRALSTESDEIAAIVDGVRITDKQLRAALSRHGVEVVDPLGEKFDPRFAEAVQRVAAAGEPGTVSRVFEKGYTLKGRLLRPARVQVVGDA